MRGKFIAGLFVGFVTLIAVCAAHAVTRKPTWVPDRVAEGECPELTALQESFYSGSTKLSAMSQELQTTLEGYPHCAELHEMAGYLAILRADDHGTWAHFLSAAAVSESSLAGLYLEQAMEPSLTRDEILSTRLVLTEIMQGDAQPEVRARAAWHLLDQQLLLGLLDEMDAPREEIGFIQHWQLIGSFENDQGKGFHAVYPPEQGVQLDAGLRGKLGEVRWRPVPVFKHHGHVPLGSLVSPTDFAAAYLATWVHADSERQLTLRITTGDPVRAWVNDQLVLSQQQPQDPAFDTLSMPITLDAGWNLLLLKSTNKGGDWQLGARLTEHDGGAASGLNYSDQTQTYPSKSAAEQEKVPSSLHDLAAGSDVEPSVRRRVLQAQSHALLGHLRSALRDYDDLVGDFGQSPLIIYSTALLAWARGEGEKAIDLFNLGMALEDVEFPAYLYRRGRFYSQRERHQDAVDDLERAVSLAPESRKAAMELAGVYAQRKWPIERCRTLEGVLDPWPEFAWATRELAKCQQDRGYRVESMESLKRAQQILPGDEATTHALFKKCRARADYRSALKWIRLTRRLAPWKRSYILDEGNLLRIAGERAEAREVYQSAVAQAPDWPKPYLQLGKLAFEDGDSEGSIALWEAALLRDPDDTSLAEHLDHIQPRARFHVEELLLTDEQIQEAISSAGAVELLPGADVILLVDDKVTELEADASKKHLVTEVRMAVTEGGRERMVKERYPTKGRTRVLQAYSITPEGERQEASSIRSGAVRFRNLQAGSLTVLQYVQYARQDDFLADHYADYWFGQHASTQYERSRWAIIMPPKTTLQVVTQGEMQHQTDVIAGRQVHLFTSHHAPPIVPEIGMPPLSDVAWSAWVSTLPSWDEYVQWERALMTTVFRSDPELSAIATATVEGASDNRERLDRLLRYVAQDIRYQQDYEDTIAGVKPHACPVVVSRGYGDCKDKSVLFIQLAREIGLDAHFAILRTRSQGTFIPEVPNQQFNHAIVYIPPQEGIDDGYFVDPTASTLEIGTLPWMDQGAASLVMEPFTDEWSFIDIPYQEHEHPQMDMHTEFEVEAPGQVTGAWTLSLRGTDAGPLREIVENEQKATMVYGALTNLMLTGAVATSGSSSDPKDLFSPLDIHLDVDASQAMTQQGDVFRLPLPNPLRTERRFALAERALPLVMGPPYRQRLHVSVELPAGASLLDPPADLDIDADCLRAERTTRRSQRTIDITTEISWRCPRIEPDQYEDYRRMFVEIQSAMEEPLRLTGL